MWKTLFSSFIVWCISMVLPLHFLQIQLCPQFHILREYVYCTLANKSGVGCFLIFCVLIFCMNNWTCALCADSFAMFFVFRYLWNVFCVQIFLQCFFVCRYYAIVHPMKAHYLCTTSQAKVYWKYCNSFVYLQKRFKICQMQQIARNRCCFFSLRFLCVI